MNDVQLLIAEFLSGNSRTFDAVRSRIMRYLRKHSAAKYLETVDICSEILMVLINNFRSNKFTGNSSGELNAYIFRIANNYVCDHIKKSRRRTELENDLILENQEYPNLERVLITRSIIDSLFSDLDEKCENLLKLKFMEGLSDQEIADKMNKSKNSISTALSRCLKTAQESKIIKKILKQSADRYRP